MRRWNAFWFAPTDPATLGVVRIVVGATVVVWALTLLPDLDAFYGTAGIAGDLHHGAFATAAAYVALVAGAVALTVGWHSRTAAALAFVAMTWLARANPYVVNSGDTLLRLLVLLLALAPSGLAYSVHRRPGAMHPAWPLRLIQIQIAVMYVAAVWSKLHGATWRDGTAASYAMRLPDLVRFPAPSLLEHSTLAAAVATYGAILIEAAIVVLVWNRRTRVPVLLAGVALHLSIDASIRVGFFTVAVFAGYLSFVQPATVRAWTGALHRSRIAVGGALRAFDRDARQRAGSLPRLALVGQRARARRR